jgi:general secretion pathway protein A
MLQALKAWKKPVPADNQVDCPYIKTQGLHCLFDKANWKDLLELNRPAILEFTLASEEKRYALLTGVRQGQALLRFDADVSFPLAEVLNLWNGYYLMLWQSPRPGMTDISPLQISGNVLWLRQQLNADNRLPQTANPQLFDGSLKTEVINFQRRHHLTADGIVGARTLIHLDNAAGAADSPHLEITD